LADFTLKLKPLIANRVYWNPGEEFSLLTARAVPPLNFLSDPKLSGCQRGPAASA